MTILLLLDTIKGYHLLKASKGHYRVIMRTRVASLEKKAKSSDRLSDWLRV